MDDLEQKNEGFDLSRYAGLVRRRHLHFLIPMVLGWAAVWGTSWILPARYKSTTLILVEQPTMPKDYVLPNISVDIQERLQSITQQILSRTRLLHIIDEMKLYAAEHAPLSPDEKIEQMRQDIGIELVRDSQNRINAFNVSYLSGDPRVAQQVTSQLTNLFISENLEARQQESEDTTKFLESHLADAQKTLADQEERIRGFKAQHVAELPAQLESNLQILGGMQSQLRAEETALNNAQQQRVYLQTLIGQYDSLSSSGTESNDVGLPALDRELERLRSHLRDLTSHYTGRHPDVRKTQEQIAETEKRRDQLLEDQKTDAADDSSEKPSSESRKEPADLKPSSPLIQLQGQLKSNQAEIANRERSIAELKTRISEYQARLNHEPVREQELADLTRGYDQTKANYDDLLKKRNESAMATSMELRQQGERFRILDPPSLPLKSDFPNRLKFCFIGIGVGVGLGIVVAGTFEALDPRVYDEKELKSLLPVAVMVEIPMVTSPVDEKRTRRQLWMGWAAATVVIGAILWGSLFSYFRG